MSHQDSFLARVVVPGGNLKINVHFSFLVAIFNMFLMKAKRDGTNNIDSEKKDLKCDIA